MKPRRIDATPGVAALTTLLGISVVIVVLGTALGFLAFFETAISASQMRSQEALLVAQAGISDALLRLAQNKDFSAAPTGYTINLSNGTSTIVVTQDQPQTGQVLITSTGEVYNRKRKIEVKVAVDDTSGQVTIISWREISL